MDAGVKSAFIHLHAISCLLPDFVLCLLTNHHHAHTISPKKKAAGFWLPAAFYHDKVQN